MDETITVRARFDAHHVNPDFERCARNHGHRWTIYAEALGNGQRPEPNQRLEADLRKAIEPWADKSLNEIAGSGDPWHVAAWVMEMLILNHPGLFSVSLDDDRMRATVRRTPR